MQGSNKVDFYAVWQQQTLNGLTLPLPLPDEYYCAPLSDYIDDNETPPQGVVHR